MATSGSQPNVTVDVPIVSVLLFLYASSAAINMFVFQRNRRRGIIFIPTVLLVSEPLSRILSMRSLINILQQFGFSMARVLTCILRIVWATMPQAASTALAAQVSPTHTECLRVQIRADRSHPNRSSSTLVS